jgi:hypothetical protein
MTLKLKHEARRLAWVRNLAKEDPSPAIRHIFVREQLGMTQAIGTDGYRLHAAFVAKGFPYMKPQLFTPEQVKKGLPVSSNNPEMEAAAALLKSCLRSLEDMDLQRPRIHTTAWELKAALEHARYRYPRINHMAEVVCVSENSIEITRMVNEKRVWVKTADREKAEKKGRHKGQVRVVEWTNLLEGHRPITLRVNVQNFSSPFSFRIHPNYLLQALPIDGSIVYQGEYDPLIIEHDWGFAAIMPARVPK